MDIDHHELKTKYMTPPIYLAKIHFHLFSCIKYDC